MIKKKAGILIGFLGLVLSNQAAFSEVSQNYNSVVESVVTDVIIPRYQAFQQSTIHFNQTVETFCAAPNSGLLDKVKEDYANVIISFSRIEMFRFGPARTDNNFERLFFWPDRKGRGNKQVQKIIEDSAKTPADLPALKSKSVAVQGLTALDSLLSGKNDNALLLKGHHTCEYILTISALSQETANTLLNDWEKADGYGALMLSAGANNPVYRSQEEALQEILRASKEQLQILRDQKLLSTLNSDIAKAKLKRAPFWRTNNTLLNYAGNVDAVVELLNIGNITSLLPEYESSLINELIFELSHVKRVITQLDKNGMQYSQITQNKNAYDKLTYATIPLASSIEILSERLPAALDLTMGFNSLDGD